MVNGFAATIQPSDTFSLITAQTISGAFANEPATGPWFLTTVDGLGSFQVNISGGTLSLSNFTAIPEPTPTWLPILVGLATAVISACRRFRLAFEIERRV